MSNGHYHSLFYEFSASCTPLYTLGTSDSLLSVLTWESIQRWHLIVVFPILNLDLDSPFLPSDPNLYIPVRTPPIGELCDVEQRSSLLDLF